MYPTKNDLPEAARAKMCELDAATADLMTEVSRAADKDLWFVEAHLQGAR